MDDKIEGAVYEGTIVDEQAEMPDVDAILREQERRQRLASLEQPADANAKEVGQERVAQKPLAQVEEESRELFPPIKAHIVPVEELNPRGNPSVAHTAAVSPRALPTEDPRVTQMRQESRENSANAVAALPQRGRVLTPNPGEGQPRSAADYFMREVAEDISRSGY